MRKLLVLDSSYTLEIIRNRKLEHSVVCRDLGGFFKHVWTVHPFSTLVPSEQLAPRYGKFVVHQFACGHTFIEGKVGRFAILHRMQALNFLISQVSIFLFLSSLIRKEKITVIRVGSPLYLGLFGWALSRWTQIPFVVRVGGNHDKIYSTIRKPIEERLFFHRWIEKKVERFVLCRADLVAGANQDNLNFALANGARPECSTLFRYGNLIDKLHFIVPSERMEGCSLLRDIGVEPHCFVLYIGRLEKVKHPDHVLTVVSSLQRQGFSISAVLVGDGRERSTLVSLSQALGISDKVVFAGNRDQDWISRIIPLSVAVLSPHTGRALSEAALGGVPIVAYDIDWQSELIQTGVTGELAPYLDVVSMEAALRRFLKDSKYAEAMGTAVRKKVLEMMDPEILNEHERDQYRAVIARYGKLKSG